MNKLFNWTESSYSRNKISALYEPIQPYLFLSFMEYTNAKVMLDLGANVGLYTILSSSSSNVERIVSFEPEKASYDELVENISINGLSKVVEPVFKLVSDANVKRMFGVHSALSGINGVLDSSIHDKVLFQEIRKLDSITLDSFFNYSDTTLAIKIDVEGHELNVLKGAENLLTQNPSFIQIEHYVGTEIDDFLSNIGYSKIHSAGHDYYYSNISNFRSAEFVNRAISHAHALLIDHSTGTFKCDKLLSQALELDFDIKNKKLHVTAELTSDKFLDGPFEYAFYLIKDGEKQETRWYSNEKTCEFDLPEELKGYSLKGFIREINNPKKMTSREMSISRNEVEHGARSASPDSYNSPVNSIVVNSSRSSFHYELDFEWFLAHKCSKKGNNIVLLGSSRLKSEMVALFLKYFRKVATIFYTNAEQETQFNPISEYKHISTSSQGELCNAIRNLKNKDKNKEYNCYVILDSLFNSLPLSESVIKKITEQVDRKDVFACQALTNKSYRDLLEQCSEQLVLIPAKSSIEKGHSILSEEIATGKQINLSSVVRKLNFEI